MIERRRLPVRLDQLYAAHPDAIAELQATADTLQNVPREWLETREDMCHGLRRVAGRLRQIAERIEIIEPIAASKKGAAPKLARIATRPTRGRPAPEGQMTLAL